MQDTAETKPARTGRRRGRGAGTAGPQPIRQLPYHQPRLPFAPVELLSADELEQIHETSLKVLEEIGMEFMLPEARDLLRQAGADRILTRRWVRESTRPFATGDGEGVIEERGYGYLWWTARGERIHDIYYAAGYAGQLIVNIPALQITIVTAA